MRRRHSWPRGIGRAVGAAARLWRFWVATFDRLDGVLLVAVLTFGAGAALAFLAQGRDLLLAVADDGGDLGSQVFAFGLGMLFLGIQAWFWPRLVIVSNYGADRSAWRPQWLLEWTPRVLGVAPFVFVVLGVSEGQLHNPGELLLITGVGLALLVFFVRRTDLDKWRAARRVAAAAKRGPTSGPQPAKARPASAVRPLFGRGWAIFSLVFAPIAVAIDVISPVDVARALGAPAVVFFGVGLIIPWAVTLVQLAADFRLPLKSVVAVLLLVVSVCPLAENHLVGRRQFGKALDAPAQETNLEDAYVAWRRQAPRETDGSIPMVLVASEGGASRAGFWTGEVLSALHSGTPGGRFDQSVFAISSVSGGSVGAVGYVAALKENPAAGSAAFLRRVEGLTGADALSPVAGGLLYADLAQRFIPLAIFPDRAEALERSWESAWDAGCPATGCAQGLFGGPYLGLWSDWNNGWRRPAVIINGADEETGRAILTSKIHFDPREIDADDFYYLRTAKAAPEAKELRDIAASTAIHNGARFPWISPAGLIRPAGSSGSNSHIVDGGYFDGAGGNTLRQLAEAIQSGPAACRHDQIHFIIVFIGYDGAAAPGSPLASNDTAFTAARDADIKASAKAGTPPPEGAPAKMIGNELVAPLLAVFASRDGHAEQMSAMLRLLVDPHNTADPFAPFDSRIVTPPSTSRDAPFKRAALLRGDYAPIVLGNTASFDGPLDWALSRAAMQAMRMQAGNADPNPNPPKPAPTPVLGALTHTKNNLQSYQLVEGILGASRPPTAAEVADASPCGQASPAGGAARAPARAVAR